MAESRGGRGNAVLTGFRLHRPAAKPTTCDQIPRSFGQECPKSRYPDMLWYSRMPRPLGSHVQWAGEPRTMGAMYNGYTVSGVWTGPQLRWHFNCLELLAVRLALSHLRGHLQHKDVLVRTDNRATIAYINRQGSLRSRRMSQLTRHLSEASEVPSSHPHPRSVQSGSRRAVSSSTSRGVETPSPGSSADLGTVQSCSGGPVCISRNHPLP